MAQKITQEQIDKMIYLYEKLGTYTAVAKEMNISPATVSKYVKAAQKEIKTFTSTTPIAAKPISEISLDSIISFSTMTDAERISYSNWLKEFN